MTRITHPCNLWEVCSGIPQPAFPCTRPGEFLVQVILDADPWVAHMPDSIEAVYFVVGNAYDSSTTQATDNSDSSQKARAFAWRVRKVLSTQIRYESDFMPVEWCSLCMPVFLLLADYAAIRL